MSRKKKNSDTFVVEQLTKKIEKINLRTLVLNDTTSGTKNNKND